jgi:hypothetical protein
LEKSRGADDRVGWIGCRTYSPPMPRPPVFCDYPRVIGQVACFRVVDSTLSPMRRQVSASISDVTSRNAARQRGSIPVPVLGGSRQTRDSHEFPAPFAGNSHSVPGFAGEVLHPRARENRVTFAPPCGAGTEQSANHPLDSSQSLPAVMGNTIATKHAITNY